MTFNVGLVIFSAALGALIGTMGANFLIRLRMMKIEHELWGVKGDNGMKASLVYAHERIDRVMDRERRNVGRIDARNREQHPDDEDE